MANSFVAVILNPSCKQHCLFCGNIPNYVNPNIKKQEIAVLKNLIDFQKKNYENIEISGSDPIEYPKIVQLIRYIKKIGFKNIKLSTHGQNLANDDFRRSILQSGMTELRIPIYGSNPEIHDSITRTKGSFEKIIYSITKIQEESPEMRILLSSLIMDPNKNDLCQIYRLLKKYRLKDFYFSVPCVSNNDYSYLVPFKELKKYLSPLEFALKNDNIISKVFIEIPPCVLNLNPELTNNQEKPPNLGNHCQPPKRFKTSIKDMPSYRFKLKANFCKDCIYDESCDGFFANDITKYGTGNLKPITNLD
jgi:MoaA/NifB/PqqE/SkfB family radical SAM enzyme